MWKRGIGKSLFPTIDVSEFANIYTVCSSPDRLCGLNKIGVYDFYVSSTFFGNSLYTVYNFDDVKYGSGYGIILKKCKNKTDVFILQLYLNIPYSILCKLLFLSHITILRLYYYNSWHCIFITVTYYIMQGHNLSY